VNKFCHRSTRILFVARHRPMTVFTVEKIQERVPKCGVTALYPLIPERGRIISVVGLVYINFHIMWNSLPSTGGGIYARLYFIILYFIVHVLLRLVFRADSYLYGVDGIDGRWSDVYAATAGYEAEPRAPRHSYAVCLSLPEMPEWVFMQNHIFGISLLL